jgi:hypothetical protein
MTSLLRWSIMVLSLVIARTVLVVLLKVGVIVWNLQVDC